MTDDEFKIFRDLIHKECGIYLNDTKKEFLRVRTEKRMKAAGMGSFYRYYKFITGVNKDELLRFLDSVTINETYFFRNVPQFEMLREKVLPELTELKRRQRDYNLSVWSAGCSSGEEPYSIAMELLEANTRCPSLEHKDHRIRHIFQVSRSCKCRQIPSGTAR